MIPASVQRLIDAHKKGRAAEAAPPAPRHTQPPAAPTPVPMLRKPVATPQRPDLPLPGRPGTPDTATIILRDGRVYRETPAAGFKRLRDSLLT